MRLLTGSKKGLTLTIVIVTNLVAMVSTACFWAQYNECGRPPNLGYKCYGTYGPPPITTTSAGVYWRAYESYGGVSEVVPGNNYQCYQFVTYVCPDGTSGSFTDGPWPEPQSTVGGELCVTV